MANVTLVPKQTVVVRVSDSHGVLSPTPSGATTVKTTVLAPSSSTRRFDQLEDVTETAPADGAVPQYDADTDTYVVAPLSITTIDGGTF